MGESCVKLRASPKIWAKHARFKVNGGVHTGPPAGEFVKAS